MALQTTQLADLTAAVAAPHAKSRTAAAACAHAGMADHRVVHAGHTFFPVDDRVIEETVRFLREGRFGPG